MWFVSQLLTKKAVVVRYKDVKIYDRRNVDCEGYEETLYDIDFTTADTKSIPLGKDPVWKGLVDKFGRLGYDLDTPADVTRIQVEINPGNDFYWQFDRYDEEHAEQTEAVNAD